MIQNVCDNNTPEKLVRVSAGGGVTVMVLSISLKWNQPRSLGANFYTVSLFFDCVCTRRDDNNLNITVHLLANRNLTS